MTAPPHPSSMGVLIIEDEPRMRELLLRAVSSWGWQVYAVRTAEDALRSMETSTSQILLLDLNLPGMSGMDCFEQIRQRWPQTQIIILTGFGDLEAARKAIHLDVVEFLNKPCHLGELEQAIDRARRRLMPGEPDTPQTPNPAPTPPADSDCPPTLEEIERQHIFAALLRNRGNRTATAAELGISLRTLYYRLSEYQNRGYNIDE